MTLTSTANASASAGPSEAEKQFQEKMKERMRAAMGDLMPDEVLAGIVGRGIDEAFFKKRTVSTAQYPYTAQEHDSWIVAHISQAVEVEVRAQVKKWFVENHERVSEIVKERLQGGIAAAVVRSMDAMFVREFSAFSASIQTKLDEIRNGRA